MEAMLMYAVLLCTKVLCRSFKRKVTHLCTRWELETVVLRKDSLFLVINVLTQSKTLLEVRSYRCLWDHC